MRRLPPMLFAAFSLTVVAGPGRSEDLALRRVMLSSGGVGYFEYAAQATGNATLALEVPRAAVDDVLASLLVFDDAGRVGGAELPGADTAQAAFAGVPFGPGAFAAPLAYLNALQGVVLEVRGPRPMTGALLHAESVEEPATPPAVPARRTRVSLLTATGLQQFVLEDAESVAVADPALRGKVAAALAALQGQAGGERRRLALRIEGSGARAVHVGYVAAVPLWKATYRVVLPEAGAGGAWLQVWGVFENRSGADWDGIELALQYGNPVTFRQALYRAYYAQRPEVPVDILGRVLPAPAEPPHPMARAAALAAAAPALAMATEAPAAAETVAATVFRLAAPVSLAAGHSATLPILEATVPAERLDLVSRDRAHPLDAVRLTNDTKASLPAGMLTLYQRTPQTGFIGNARLRGLPPGERSVLGFGEDLHSQVAWRDAAATEVVAVSAAQGVLRVVRRNRQTARITLTAPADAARTMLIELPRPANATLTIEDGLRPEPDAGAETRDMWRVAVALAAGTTRTVVAHTDEASTQTVSLGEDDAALAEVLGAQALDPAARAAVEHVAALRSDLAARQADAKRLAEARATIEQDEARLRQNLAAVPVGDALHNRLVRALDADETRLEALNAQRETQTAALQQARAKLDEAVAALRF